MGWATIPSWQQTDQAADPEGWARWRAAASTRAAYRRRAWRQDRFVCEVCGWTPPVVLDPKGEGRGLCVHHVVPVACGGSDEDENLVLLCPNHHAIADNLGRTRSRGLEGNRYFGPRTREELLETLRRLDVDPDGWERDEAAAVARLVAE